jgi:hypothetical protein
MDNDSERSCCPIMVSKPPKMEIQRSMDRFLLTCFR